MVTIESPDGTGRRTVHASRIDRMDGDIRREIDAGRVRVVNRWLRKKSPEKTKARRS